LLSHRERSLHMRPLPTSTRSTGFVSCGSKPLKSRYFLFSFLSLFCDFLKSPCDSGVWPVHDVLSPSLTLWCILVQPRLAAYWQRTGASSTFGQGQTSPVSTQDKKKRKKEKEKKKLPWRTVQIDTLAMEVLCLQKFGNKQGFEVNLCFGPKLLQSYLKAVALLYFATNFVMQPFLGKFARFCLAFGPI
jgi:hypothetical protein